MPSQLSTDHTHTHVRIILIIHVRITKKRLVCASYQPDTDATERLSRRGCCVLSLETESQPNTPLVVSKSLTFLAYPDVEPSGPREDTATKMQPLQSTIAGPLADSACNCTRSSKSAIAWGGIELYRTHTHREMHRLHSNHSGGTRHVIVL